MIQGIGVDIVELARLDLTHRHFIERVLAAKELETYDALKSVEAKRAFLGSRFAAKEAFLKAHHLGLGGIPFRTIEIANDKNGAPYFLNSKAHLSLSHEKNYAIAFVVIEKEEEGNHA